MRKNTEVTATMTNTMAVVMAVSRRVGQVTFWASARTSCMNLNGLIFAMIPAAALSGVGRSPLYMTFPDHCSPPQVWQEWRDSNPQPPVLETGALAIELHSSGSDCGGPKVRRRAFHAMLTPYLASEDRAGRRTSTTGRGAQ